jgi:hypothetical protein
MMSGSFGTWLSLVLVSLLSLTGGPARAEESPPESDPSSALGSNAHPAALVHRRAGLVLAPRRRRLDRSAGEHARRGRRASTGEGANLELQIGARAYARAGEDTQLGLATLEPDYLRLRLANGTAALDVRELPSGQTLEINTPNAAFTIERPGYFRIEVTDGATRFISRRGGRATVETATGLPEAIGASEQVVVTGTDAPVLATYAAPELDDWDRWNYDRADEQVASTSARYVPAGVYGVDDLDRNGNWQVVPTYGSVWVPRVAVGWAPYSTGTWVADPYYGWTWVDDAPWGWAPFHYGRWVYVNSYWAWAPGPRIVRPYYSPALVAFYASPSVSVSVSFGVPFGWVALGWGEPVVPWWGPRGCRGVARWSGWGGPRVVNNVTVKNNYYVDVNNIHHYQHAGRRGAMVTVDKRRFGRDHVRHARLDRFDSNRLAPVRGGELGVRPDRRSLHASDRRGSRPSRDVLDRRVVPPRAGSLDSAGARVETREPRSGAAQRERARSAPRSDFQRAGTRLRPCASRARRPTDAARCRTGRAAGAPRLRASAQLRLPASDPRTPRPGANAPAHRARRRRRRASARLRPRASAPVSPRPGASAPRHLAPPRRRHASAPRSSAGRNGAPCAALDAIPGRVARAPRRDARPRSQPRTERAAPHSAASAPRRARARSTCERSGGSQGRVNRESARPQQPQVRERASQPRSQPAPGRSREGPSRQSPRGGDGGRRDGGGRDSDGSRTRRG